MLKTIRTSSLLSIDVPYEKLPIQQMFYVRIPPGGTIELRGEDFFLHCSMCHRSYQMGGHVGCFREDHTNKYPEYYNIYRCGPDQQGIGAVQCKDCDWRANFWKCDSLACGQNNPILETMVYSKLLE